MNSTTTKFIVRELAVKYGIPADDIRKICRSQFEFTACLMETTPREEVKSIYLPGLVEWDVKYKLKRPRKEEEDESIRPD